MEYKDADHDKKEHKKKMTREDFKNDVAAAVKKGLEKPKKKRGKKGMYDNMSVAELRKLLTDKKKALLTKAGFPNGTLPRSKADMIALCKRFKRKRW